MKRTTLIVLAGLFANSAAALTDTELKALSAEIITLNGFSCGRVLAVQPTDIPDVWQVSCISDGAMDALVTYRMDARTGLVSGS
ncbi:hypothetical protein [uncultured Sulfitobacter sp.]|uniref:hypothetical protein n=1 Tax=uncultured Sulfitobacter sp. TaxID=191468 RepID=UPI002637E9FD|nr:hypothetical protein [uncultured Sulfitobacter sp.]